MRHLLLVLLLASFLPLKAQYIEVGVGAGIANYIGDLSANSSKLYLSETQPAATVFMRYNLPTLLSFRLGVQYLRASGNDANAGTESIRRRNLSFFSNVFALDLIAEFNLPGYDPNNLYRPFSPYLYGGISVNKFSPKTAYGGENIALQPLGTEGQGLPGRDDPYSLTSLAIPLGLGLKYALNDSWNIGLDIGGRYLFTDYVDDVGGTYLSTRELAEGNGPLAADLANRTGELSGIDAPDLATGTPRGDNKNNDWLFSLQLTVSHNFLDTGMLGSRGRRKKGKGCKSSNF